MTRYFPLHTFRKPIFRTATLIAAFALIQSGCGFAQSKPLLLFHESHPAMGTVFTIDLYAPDRETAEEWMQISFNEVDRIEALLSNYRPTSELSRISREAPDHPVTTDPETFAFLSAALDWSSRSQGTFDMTVGPLMRAWGFFFDKGRIPSKEELGAIRKQIGWQKVHLDASNRTVSFADHTRIELDPGGIGKGYAVDHMVALFRQQHVPAALISAGTSTIYGLGAPPSSQGWIVRIPDPAHTGKVLTTATLKDTSLSTSGCTEKFFVKDGHRYCHIIDPRNMHPVENMLQTTVISPGATDSDALSTAVFVMGIRGATRLIKSLPRTAAVIVSGTTKSPSYTTLNWPVPLNGNQSAITKRGN